VLNKIPNAYASTWGLQMPYWLGIYWAAACRMASTALPIQSNGQRLWDGYLGQRVSFGCVILSTQNANDPIQLGYRRYAGGHCLVRRAVCCALACRVTNHASLVMEPSCPPMSR